MDGIDLSRFHANSTCILDLVEEDPSIPYNTIAFLLTAESIVHGHVVHPSRRQMHQEKEAERVQQGKPINSDPYQMLPTDMMAGSPEPLIARRNKTLKKEET